MSAIANFRVKYPRPTKLSDPYHDFSGDMLAKLLAVPDDELNNVQYRLLLGPHLPAGTYEEIVYFVPGAFRYLLEKEDAFEFTYSLIGFVSQNAERLESDGILETVRDCIRECFERWTVEFVGDSPQLDFYHVAHIDDLIDELVRFKTHVDISQAFVRELAYNDTDPVKAAWFLELVRFRREEFQILGDSKPKHPTIERLTDDEKRLNIAAQLVKRWLIGDGPAPTYWRDTFKLLNLD